MVLERYWTHYQSLVASTLGQNAMASPERLRRFLDGLVRSQRPGECHGCPVARLGLVDDECPGTLRRQAAACMDQLARALADCLRAGIAAGHFRTACDPEGVATLMVAAIQGGMQLSAALGDPGPLAEAVAAAYGLLSPSMQP